MIAVAPAGAPRAPFTLPIVRTPASVRGRCYCLHGLNDTIANWVQTAAYFPLWSGLLADHWQLVFAPELYDGQSGNNSGNAHNEFVSDTAGKGARYRGMIVKAFTDLKAWVDYTYGPPVGGRDAILGISWGGLAATLIAQSGVQVRSFVAHLPATNPSVMTEFTGDDTTGLHPATALIPHNGWMSWGTGDSRVGYTDTKTLAQALNALNAGIQAVEYVGEVHDTNPTNIADMLAFMAAQ